MGSPGLTLRHALAKNNRSSRRHGGKLPTTGEVSRLLQAASAGDADALAKIVPLVYDELRRIASAYLRRERSDHTLQTTSLVHESYLRLVGQADLSWRNRAHFRAIAANTMRRVLVDHARARSAQKRGGGQRVALEDDAGITSARSVDVQAVDQALTRLAELDPQQARVVELRFFAGLSVEEAAAALGISTATVKRDWAMARAWLRRELEGPSA